MVGWYGPPSIFLHMSNFNVNVLVTFWIKVYPLSHLKLIFPPARPYDVLPMVGVGFWVIGVPIPPQLRQWPRNLGFRLGTLVGVLPTRGGS